MTRLKKSVLALAVLCPVVAFYAGAQVQTPAAVSNTMPTPDFGFNLPTSLGTLTYSLSAAESLRSGYSSTDNIYASTSAGGNLAYLSKNETNPFSLVYAGGFIHSDTPGAGKNETYQDLAFSQVLRTKAWVYVFSDSLSYLPQSPTTGLSGVAGVGDVGVTPVQGIGPSQDILTDYGRRVGNGLDGSATWQMTGRTELQGSGSWRILRFVGSSPGLDTTQYSATLGPNYRINALNSVGASAFYSRQNYPGYAGAIIESEGITATYSRTWSRSISTTVGAGPEATHGEGFGSFPSRLNLSANASLTYASRRIGATVSYSRGVNGGSGVIPGAFSDRVMLGAERPIGRDWSLGLDASYSRSVGLFANSGIQTRAQSVYGGAQISRKLAEKLSCFASYTGIHQSFTGLSNVVGAAHPFSGLNNTVAVGITFSPAPLHRAR